MYRTPLDQGRAKSAARLRLYWLFAAERGGVTLSDGAMPGCEAEALKIGSDQATALKGPGDHELYGGWLPD